MLGLGGSFFAGLALGLALALGGGWMDPTGLSSMHPSQAESVAAHGDGDGGAQQGGWRWSPSGTCKRYSDTRSRLEVSAATAGASGDAIDIFRACGVVGVADAFPSRHFVDSLASAVETEMAPFLESRARIRSVLRQAMANHRNLRTLWNTNSSLREELLFRRGHVYKERDDGRIDLELPWRTPFNRCENPSTFGDWVVLRGTGLRP